MDERRKAELKAKAEALALERKRREQERAQAAANQQELTDQQPPVNKRAASASVRAPSKHASRKRPAPRGKNKADAVETAPRGTDKGGAVECGGQAVQTDTSQPESGTAEAAHASATAGRKRKARGRSPRPKKANTTPAPVIRSPRPKKANTTSAPVIRCTRAATGASAAGRRQFEAVTATAEAQQTRQAQGRAAFGLRACVRVDKALQGGCIAMWFDASGAVVLATATSLYRVDSTRAGSPSVRKWGPRLAKATTACVGPRGDVWVGCRMKGGPRVMVVDPTTGKPRASMDLPGPAQALHAIGDSAAAVAAGGAVLVAELGEDGSAMSAAEFPLPGTAVGPELEGHAWQLAGVANHPQRLLGLCGTAVVVWNVETRAAELCLTLHTRTTGPGLELVGAYGEAGTAWPVYLVLQAVDQCVLVRIDAEEPMAVELGQYRVRMGGHVAHQALSPGSGSANERVVAAVLGGDGGMAVWDVATGGCMATILPWAPPGTTARTALSWKYEPAIAALCDDKLHIYRGPP